LVGCNLASNNLTDDSTSAYGAEMLQKLKGIGVSSASARSDYVAIGPDGKKLTSSTGANPWRHKDGNFIKFSAINHSVSAVFVHLHDGGFCWVFEGEFKGAVSITTF
jgi:hypothetical protein